MTPKRGARGIVSRDQWAAQIAALDGPPAASRPRREPITAARIVDAALRLVEADGYDALTMRRVAAVLDSSPGALYAHVRDKADLDDLMIGELCSRVTLPTPDPAQWMAQVTDVCRQLRDQYLRYPGISRATLAAAPVSLDTLRINEGLLEILVAAGASPRSAAWATDAAFLYIAAYSVAALRRSAEDADGPVDGRAEWTERFRMLPPDRFPVIVTHAGELASGEGHDRFDFTLGRLFAGLTDQTAHQPAPTREEQP
jgi:AcrR family transcriptional regulator